MKVNEKEYEEERKRNETKGKGWRRTERTSNFFLFFFFSLFKVSSHHCDVVLLVRLGESH